MLIADRSKTQSPGRRPVVRIGLVNNMPDAALEGTERQFSNLLSRAAGGGFDVRVTRYALTGVPRGDAGAWHLAQNLYKDARAIAEADLDGLIVTGSEPVASDLRDEPYWAALADLFDWIATEGPSTIFSCLASHAAVLHFDGIIRRRLPQKRLGVFEHRPVARHDLTGLLYSRLHVAHSRWNEVTPDALERHGYEILTYAPEAGVDLFIKQRKNLLLFFQGHPEYEPSSLLREYKRDVKRFLSGQTDAYPAAPANYFREDEAEALAEFASFSRAHRHEQSINAFPVNACDAGEGTSWNPYAVAIYRAWLSHIASEKSRMSLKGARVSEPAGLRQS